MSVTFEEESERGDEKEQENRGNNGKDYSEMVAFTATVTQAMTSQNGQTLVFPHIITNVGGGYNGSNGVFTAPRNGVYVLFCRITGINNSGDLFFEFTLNGSAKTRNLLLGGSAHPYRSSSNSIVLQLRHGDRDDDSNSVYNINENNNQKHNENNNNNNNPNNDNNDNIPSNDNIDDIPNNKYNTNKDDD
uniref:Small heat shock protein hspM-like n=1 Tax=Crassostrea virginica TaxID=6565 RepID=A0A8B8AIP6_CRAVI|nr:small heat shock protein hspM-like [Crassostrea virginica]